MIPLLAAVWPRLDYPWGLLAFVAIATLHGLRCFAARPGDGAALIGDPVLHA